VTATPGASLIKTVSHGSSTQTQGGDVLLGVTANAAVTSEAVAGTFEGSSVCKVAGLISEPEASQALKEVMDKLQDENAKGSDRNAKAAKDDTAKAPTFMWDRWTLPCCALTTRDDNASTTGCWMNGFGSGVVSTSPPLSLLQSTFCFGGIGAPWDCARRRMSV
jgi:hypothetical protein